MLRRLSISLATRRDSSEDCLTSLSVKKVMSRRRRDSGSVRSSSCRSSGTSPASSPASSPTASPTATPSSSPVPVRRCEPHAQETSPLYRSWWNHHLQKRGLQIEAVDDLRSGVLPFALAQVLVSEEYTPKYASPTTQRQCMHNLLGFVAILRAEGVPLVSANGSTRRVMGQALPESIDEYTALARALSAGQVDAFSSLTWSLILRYDVCAGERDLPVAEGLRQLLQWVRAETDGYDGVVVGETRYAWSSGFSDGLAFCALLHAYDGSLVDWRRLSRASAQERLIVVFGAAADALDVPRLCSPPAMLEGDPRLAIAYTAALRLAIETERTRRVRIAHGVRVRAEAERAEAARAAAQAEAEVEAAEEAAAATAIQEAVRLWGDAEAEAADEEEAVAAVAVVAAPKVASPAPLDTTAAATDEAQPAPAGSDTAAVSPRSTPIVSQSVAMQVRLRRGSLADRPVALSVRASSTDRVAWGV